MLAGGTTPQAVYRSIAAGAANAAFWDRVDVYWGDERYVSHDDQRSNYRMARETLLARVPLADANIHPMPTHFDDPAVAARDYEQTLRTHFAGEWPHFDLVLLGMGADGHTASLFPGSPALAERTRWVMPAITDADPPDRLTLTLPALNAARHIHFLVAGHEKAHAVARALSGSADPSICPAAGVQPAGGEVTWWLDEAAAGKETRGR